MTVDFALGIALAVVLTAVVGWSITRFRLRRRVQELDRAHARVTRDRGRCQTPLDVCISGTWSAHVSERRRKIERYARHVREKVHGHSGEAYWSQFRNSPEFVVLFIPGEQFPGAALAVDPDLQEEALPRKVTLATPNDRLALLENIAFGWRRQAVAENAEKMRREGRRLHERVVTFIEHLVKTGRNLHQSVDSCNRGVGSLEHQLLPGARRFTEMGIQPKKAQEDPQQIEVSPRVVTKDESAGAGDSAADDGHEEKEDSGTANGRE